MKSTSRVIVPFCDSLSAALHGVGAYTANIKEDLNEAHHYAEISTVEKDGKTQGTILYFDGKTPYDLFPSKFKQRG